MSYFKKFLYDTILNVKTIALLNFVDYTGKGALKELGDFCGFEYYGNKHLENSLTAFIQLYWFVKKFGVDKRKSHLSSMIVSGQLTRDEALELLKKPLYNESEMQDNINYILKEIDLSKAEFDKIMSEPSKKHGDYKVSHFNDYYKILTDIFTSIK